MTRGARIVPGPAGDLEVLTTGRGEPHTLFVHGLAGSIGTTRPYASAVRGSRSFVHLRGHGASQMPAGEWGYAELAAEVRAAADAVGARRALGVSMGAGALLAGLADDPDRFDRVVLVIPAALDAPRGDTGMSGLSRLADRLEAGDVDGAAAEVLAEQPAAVQDDPAVVDWCRERAEEMVSWDAGLVRALRVVPGRTPLVDRAALAEVRCPVLVLAQADDPVHPVAVAEEIAEVLPSAVLQVAGRGGIMWEHRDESRALVGGFLSAP